MKKLPILILALALMLMSGANAELIVNKYSNDFTASSPYNEQLKLCSCETKVDRLIVENTGNFYSNFHVAIQSDYPRDLRIVPRSFELAPKHFKEILVYIEDSCNVQGTFNYDVSITNSYGRSEQISRTIDVQQCQTTMLDVTPASQTVGTCEPAEFEVEVTNIGSYSDTFSVDFAPYNEQAIPELQSFVLEPGESYSQEVTFEFHCAIYGEKTLGFAAIPSKGAPVSTTRPLSITNDYAYQVALDTEMEVCAQSTTQIPINIENLARLPTQVNMQMDAARFASFANDEKATSVSLEGFEDKDVNLQLSPGGADIGTHQLSIRTTDTYGGITKERSATLKVNNCYDPALEFRLDALTAAPDYLQTCCGPKTFYVNLRNDGDREQAFQLRLDGPSIYVLDETTVRVEPAQNVNVPLRADMPCTDSTYPLTVYAWPVGQPNVNISAQFTVESQTQRTCHMVQIDDDELTVRDDQTVLPVIVKHTGIEGGNYTITMDNELFSISEQEISLQPGEQKAIHFTPIVNLSEQPKGRYIAQPDLTLQDLGIEYKEHVGLLLKGKGFFQRLADWFFGLPWASVTVCGWFALAMLLLALIMGGVLVIQWATGAFFANGIDPGALALLKWLVIGAIILLMITMLFVPSPSREMQYERIAAGQNATVLEWYQNEQLTVDIDQYFEDPDMDELAYTATQPSDISIRIEESLMTLTPDHNFAGENTLVITASDRKGGITDSPVFLLRVIPKKDLGFFVWLGIWCVHITIGLGVVTLVLFYLFLLTIKERREPRQKKHVLVVVDEKRSGRKAVRKAKKRRTVRSAKKAKSYFYTTEGSSTYHKKGCRTLSRTATEDLKRVKNKKAAAGMGLSSCSICLPQVGVQSIKKSSQKRTKSSKKRTSTRSSEKKSVAKAIKRPSGEVARRVSGDIVSPEPFRSAKEGQSQTVNIAVGQPTVPGVSPEEVVFIGSKTGNSVHLPGCIMASRIPKENRVAFGSKKEAMDAGLVPCKVCRPF